MNVVNSVPAYSVSDNTSALTENAVSVGVIFSLRVRSQSPKQPDKMSLVNTYTYGLVP